MGDLSTCKLELTGSHEIYKQEELIGKVNRLESENKLLFRSYTDLKKEVSFLKSLLTGHLDVEKLATEHARQEFFDSIQDSYASQINETLNNTQEISVYCDCSQLIGKPFIGVSACYVGEGKVQTEAAEIETNIDSSTYAELLAIKYALEKLPKISEHYDYSPKRYKIYTDVDVIDSYMQGHLLKKPYMKETIQSIKDMISALSSKEIDIDIAYLGNDPRHFYFHKSAHTASRKAIGKS